MKIKMAHLRERSTTGGWINFAIFDAKSTTGDNAVKVGDVANLVNMNQRHHRSKSTDFISISRRTRLEAA